MASDQPRVAACRDCNVALVTKQKKSMISPVGLFSALMFLVGVVVLFFNPIAGGVIIILAIIIGVAGKSKKTVMVCPECGKEGRTI